MTAGDPYTQPASSVLRNLSDLTDQVELDRVERRHVANRVAEGLPLSRFDLAHIRAIHRQLFQDVYAWAGQLRTVEIAKNGHQFLFARFIETGFADIHRRVSQADFLLGLNRNDFATAAGKILGDVNYVHPFRDGNGRTQLFYLEQLAAHAGHPIDLTRLDPARWLVASRAAHQADYGPMIAEIGLAIVSGPFGLSP